MPGREVACIEQLAEWLVVLRHHLPPAWCAARHLSCSM
eukprot:CAMPEP_0198531352 /NCGR_PEP_ID=MMETSP1462-20131121/26890_1 /TAXON_ID=1333877 /ORGANISM="Brandtodinium nutriculum, Strain RCC3387" /LENGTH=37 /DNA_ID= /DNA_START= /DNA_END= /DNA_ORIENTATION=